MQRLVLRTEARIVSSSSGRRVRGSITSTSIPSRASCEAACKARGAMAWMATSVTSAPERLISALPMGMA